MPGAARRPNPGPTAEPVPSVPEPRSWQGVHYRSCQAGAAEVRRLFQFAGAWAPAAELGELAWEAVGEERLVGGVLVECRGGEGFIHGPVVVDPPTGAEALEVAAQLLAAVVAQASATGMNTLFARPQGLDRLWVRAGLVPVPEALLPPTLRGRPGTGLYAWRRPGTYQVALPEARNVDVGRPRGRR